MSADFGWELPADMTPVLHAAGIDVPTSLDVLPDGESTLTIGDVAGYEQYNHQQGDNPYGYNEDCGLVSSSDVLNQFGVHVTEADVVGHAIEHGECQTISGDAFHSGGTSCTEQAQILSDYGVPAHADSGQSVEQLAADVEQGHGVIASVNAGVLWDDSRFVENGADNHAITVTGVARDPETGAIQGFYINDSGTGHSGEFVSTQTMTSAFQDTGGSCVVTDAVHVLPGDAGNGGQ